MAGVSAHGRRHRHPRVDAEDDHGEAQIYDSSTVAALDAIVLKYANKGKHVEIIGLNEPSAKWHSLSGKLGAGH